MNSHVDSDVIDPQSIHLGFWWRDDEEQDWRAEIQSYRTSGNPIQGHCNVYINDAIKNWNRYDAAVIANAYKEMEALVEKVFYASQWIMF